MPLSAREAVQADETLDRVLAAACLQAGWFGEPLENALAEHFAWLRQAYPRQAAQVFARLDDRRTTFYPRR